MNDEGVYHETNISAEQHPPKTHPRLPGPDADQKRADDPSPTPGQGSKTPGRLRFRPKDRLKTRPEFLACYSRGRRYHSRHFLLFCLPANESRKQNGVRIGLSVGRKTSNAVRRNRLKRLVREFFRMERDAFPDGTDVVVVAKRGLDPMKLTLDDIRVDLLPALRRARRDAAARCAAPLADKS